jgi:hypothetical protein
MQTYKDCIRKTAEDFGISYEECEYIIMKSSFDLNDSDDSSDEDFYIPSSDDEEEDYAEYDDDDDDDVDEEDDDDDDDEEDDDEEIERNTRLAYIKFIEKIKAYVNAKNTKERRDLFDFYSTQRPTGPVKQQFAPENPFYSDELIKYYVHMYKIYTAEQLANAGIMLNSYILLIAAFSKFNFKTKDEMNEYCEHLKILEDAARSKDINKNFGYLSDFVKKQVNNIYNAPRNGFPISWLQEYADEISKDELNKNKVKALLANDPTEFIKTMHGQDFANMIYGKL